MGGGESGWDGYLDAALLCRPLGHLSSWRSNSVLDIGVGESAFTQRRFAESSRYLSTDVCPHPTVGVLCNITSLPFRSDSFDLVLCLRVIQHVPDDLAALREIHRTVHPGGSVIIVVANRRSWTFIQGRMGNPRWRRRISYVHYRTYRVQDLTERLSHAGFRLIDVTSALYLPEIISRLPSFLRRVALQIGPAVDRVAGRLPILRSMGTNLVAVVVRP